MASIQINQRDCDSLLRTVGLLLRRHSQLMPYGPTKDLRALLVDVAVANYSTPEAQSAAAALMGTAGVDQYLISKVSSMEVALNNHRLEVSDFEDRCVYRVTEGYRVTASVPRTSGWSALEFEVAKAVHFLQMSQVYIYEMETDIQRFLNKMGTWGRVAQHWPELLEHSRKSVRQRLGKTKTRSAPSHILVHVPHASRIAEINATLARCALLDPDDTKDYALSNQRKLSRSTPI